MFVIQEKVKPWLNTWQLSMGYTKFKTAEEAQAAIEKLPALLQPSHRVAEEYTVTRYKPIPQPPEVSL